MTNEYVQNPTEEILAQKIRSSLSNQTIISTELKTSERVIARVTDGIYRQPASALRELISNAYDADATQVVIKTDAPRFAKISVEDNGLGMTPETLAHVLTNIGGSAKRQEQGIDLGITDSKDALLSPSGRRLIGKIGIGLFAVSQLTQQFQVITKTKGDDHWTVATIGLRQYSDNYKTTEEKFESGKVKIWREKATDKNAHGTTVILTSIKPQARDTLKSRSIWAGLERVDDPEQDEESQTFEPPKFHIGRVDANGDAYRELDGKFSSLPWSKSDAPEEAFGKLVDCVWNQLGTTVPKLDALFDYYLKMVWQISLSIPVPYVEGNLFDMNLAGWCETFELSNENKRGSLAKPISFLPNETARTKLKLSEDSTKLPFDVFFDDLKLFRPIKYKGLPVERHQIKHPLIFFGNARESFDGIDREISGGPIEFDAYLFWNPKIAPTEHQGSLIRVNGASGTLFDSTFAGYQVSEQTRLKQITCEIFIREGFDSTLNIDRETYNQSHPHAVFLTRWLHSALRQLATAQKRLASEIRDRSRDQQKVAKLTEIQQIVSNVWHEENVDVGSFPPSITITQDTLDFSSPLEGYSFNQDTIYPTPDPRQRNTKRSKQENAISEEKRKAIIQVLASFGVLDMLTKAKQEKLLKAIFSVMDAD